MANFASFANANSVCAGRGGGGIQSNTAMGYQTLSNNSSGYQNAAFGFQALRANSTGRQNTAVGYQALRNNTTNVCNTAIGYRALYCSNGSNNTAVGWCAGFNVTTGSSNTLIGFNAGSNIVTGNSNTVLGSGVNGNNVGNTNTAVGGAVGLAGTNNTTIGFQAGTSLSTGQRNTVVGSGAGYGISSAYNTITVSRGGTPSNSNGHTLFSTSGTNFNWIQCGWSNVSDCRDKTCVQDLDQKLGLAFLRKLTPISFYWDNRQQYVDKCGYEYGVKDGSLASVKKSYGFEAQQVEQVLKDLEVDFEALGYDSLQDAYRITYEEMIAPLIKGIQETLDRLETLEALAA